MDKFRIRSIILPNSKASQDHLNHCYYWFSLVKDTQDLTVLERLCINKRWASLKYVCLAGLYINSSNSINRFSDFTQDYAQDNVNHVINLGKLLIQIQSDEISKDWNKLFNQALLTDSKKRQTLQKHYSKDEVGIYLFENLVSGLKFFADCYFEAYQAVLLKEATKSKKIMNLMLVLGEKNIPISLKETSENPLLARQYERCLVDHVPNYGFEYVGQQVFLIPLDRKAKVERASLFQEVLSIKNLIKPSVEVVQNRRNVNVIANESQLIAQPLEITQDSLDVRKSRNKLNRTENEILKLPKISTTYDMEHSKEVSQYDSSPRTSNETETPKESTEQKATSKESKPVAANLPNEPITTKQVASSDTPKVATDTAQSTTPTVKDESKVTNEPEANKNSISNEKNKILEKFNEAAKKNPSLEAMFDISNWR